MTVAAPIPNSYWLPGGRIIAGEYPGDLYDENAEAKLRALIDAGVAVFVDLTTAEDRMTPYADRLDSIARDLGADAVHLSHPVPDMGIASSATMNAILDVIDDHVEQGLVVYVHCWGGVGRTGLVVGCHLVRHGASGAEALATVRRLFATMSRDKVTSHGGRSPQTHAQCEQVRTWSEHDRTSRRTTRP